MRKYALCVQSTPDVEKHGVMKTVNQKQTAESPQRSGMTSAGGSGHTGEAGSQTEKLQNGRTHSLGCLPFWGSPRV